MRQEQVREIFTKQFYQTLEESKVNIEAISHSQMQALVQAMADGVFAVLGGAEDADVKSNTGPLDAEEEVLWEGKPFGTIGTYYELTNQRLKIFTGLFGRNLEEVDLVRVRDTEVSQKLSERTFGVGDVTLVLADEKRPSVVLNNVKNPMEVRELIRKAYLAEHKRRGLRYRDEGL